MTESPFPTPLEHHQMLLSHVGTWDVQCTYYMDPSQPPMEAKAKETVEAVGQFWTVSKFESDFMGMPFVGRATLGYDTNAEQFVGTWIDGMSTVIFHYVGQFDADKKVLDMSGEAFMPHFQGECKFRSVIYFADDDKHQFEMFVTPPGAPEMKMFRYEYSRA